MAKRSDALQELYASIITTAVEGGINYWARVGDYEWSFKWHGDDKDDASVTVYEYGDDTEPASVHKVTTDTIAHAFTVLKKGPVKYLGEATRKRYIGAQFVPDEADLDAGDADNILQIGLFGELVYG